MNSESPTLKDIARAANLSVAAVSKVLNNREGVSQASRERVRQAMAQLDYRGRGGRSSPEQMTRVRVLTLGRHVTGESFYGDIFAGIIAAADADGVSIDIEIVGDADTEEGLVRAAKGDDPDCPLLIVGIDCATLVDCVVAGGTPAVLVNGMDRQMRLPSVSPDYYYGGWMMTRHLIDLGHRDILHITHPYRESICRRVDGFRTAIEEAGLVFSRERHLLDLGDPRLLSIDARTAISHWIARADRMPSAFVCVNDIVALAAIQELQANGLSVPRDASVIGFDDLPAGAHASPPLTTMRIDRHELGRLGFALLAARVATPTRALQRIALNASLIERGSTGPAPKPYRG